MPEFHVSYTLDGQSCSFTVGGILAEPNDRCLIDEDDNLLKGRNTEPQGHEAVRPWGEEMTRTIQAGVKNIISDAVLAVCGHRFEGALDKYHTAVSNEEHYAVVRQLRSLLHTANRYLPLKEMDAGMSRVLGFAVTCYDKNEKYFDCSLRVIRPKQPDNNPLHRDVWLNRLRHALNIYLPVAGSNALSSLSLIPGSHHWKESEIARMSDEGCSVNGIRFTVSSVIASPHGLHMVRPPLNGNEILMFSPYVIHGGARNFNEDLTRISLEMRFRRA